MSRLRELRLHGFKTFADATRFVFEPGVNAVIGPNGSGKSNMADAVRWVLGEQSNRSLRTRRADDVIFAGSQHRKPLGMAEAVLTLENADGWLPLDFAEVTIGRRAYRSGESEYLINGARARLRDVVELLGSGRLGANELVVVGQGTVDAALSLRPEERRQLFEEAAGVKNLQVRKNEALSRLARAGDNLTRVRDVIGELKPQVRRLALQAQHQQEHDELGRRAHALVGETHRRRERSGRAALGEARRTAAAAEARLEEHRASQAAARAAIAEVEERYWQADAEARAAAQAREATRETLIRAESRLEALQARLADLSAGLLGAEDELRQLSAAPSDEPDGADELGPILEAAANAEAAWRAASDALREADAASLAAEEELAGQRQAASDEIARQARAGELRASLDARVESVDAEIGSVARELEEIEVAHRAATGALGGAERALVTARQRNEAAAATLAAAQPLAAEARRRAAELAERVGAMRGELEALNERAEHGGRLGSLLSTAGWASLLNELDVPAEAWPVIEAAIGGDLEQALLWRDDELAGRLGEARGAARMLIAGPPEVEDAQRTGALAAVGASQTLAEWLGAPQAPRLFWRVAMAPDIKALLGGWRDLPVGWMAVTTHGDVADGRGLLSVRGRGEAPRVEAARRHARRRELAASLAEAEAAQEETTAEAARQHAAVADAGRVADAARAALAHAEREQAGAAGRAAEAVERRDRLASHLATLRVAREEAAQRRGEVTGSMASAAGSRKGALDELEARAVQARAAREAAAARRDAARDAWLSARATADEAEQRASGGRQRASVRAARRAQVEAELPARRAALANAEAELSDQRARVRAAREADEAATGSRTDAELERDRIRGELRNLEQDDGTVAVQTSALEQAAQLAAVEVSRHEEVLAGLQRERELALDSLPELGDGGRAGDEVPAEHRSARG